METNLIGKLKTIIDHYQGTENQLNEKLENLKAENEQLKVYEQRCIGLESVIGELKSDKVELQLKIQRQNHEISDQLGSGSGECKQQKQQLACLNNQLTQAKSNNRQLKSELNRLKNMANGKVIEVESIKYKEELRNAHVGILRLKIDNKEMKIENTRLKRELASWEEIKDNNEYLKNKVEKLKKKKEISGGGDEATKSEMIEIRHELNLLKSKHEKTVQELVLAKKQNVIQASLKSKQQTYEDKIKYLVKENADFDKLKDDLNNVKEKLKVITDENEGLNIQVKENEALKKTLKIQQEFLEIAKCHLKGEPVQKQDLEREVRRMLIEQFGQEATEKLGIEIEDGEILEDNNNPGDQKIIIDEPEKEIEVIEEQKKEIEVVQLDMDY